MTRFVGWFDDPSQTEPVSQPQFPGPCIACLQPMSEEDVRTINLMWADRKHGLSVFYRMHRTCAVSMSDRERNAYDAVVLEAMPSLAGCR